jgi:APA family basic amino acid/polyamine antiporter
VGTPPLEPDRSTQTRAPLGFWMCLALVIGNMIGSGVYLLPAALAPYGWNAIFGWILTIAGSLCLAFVFARLARAFPLLGGPYAYARLAFGDGAAFALAWSYWTSVWIANAVLAIAAVSYLSLFAPALANVPGLAAALAIGFVWAFTLVNCVSIRAAGGVQIATTILKLLPLLAAIAIIAMVVAGDGGASLAPYDSSTIDAPAVTAAASLTLWAMLGFESATIPAERVRDPERNIPRATLYGTFIVGIIYLVACSGVALLLPAEQAAQSNAPFADFVGAYWGPGPALTIALFGAISVLGALNGWVLVQGEMPLALARNGVFPRWFAATSKAGTPVRAQCVSSGLVTLLLVANYQRTMAEMFVFMVLLGTVAVLITYLFCSLAALRLMRSGAMMPSRWVAATAVLGFLYSVWTVYGAGAEATGWGAVLLVSGIPVYLLMRRSSRAAAGLASASGE